MGSSARKYRRTKLVGWLITSFGATFMALGLVLFISNGYFESDVQPQQELADTHGETDDAHHLIPIADAIDLSPHPLSQTRSDDPIVPVQIMPIAPQPIATASDSAPEADKPQEQPAAKDPLNQSGELGIDFGVLKSVAPDAYAWIQVPNTNINAPVMQHANQPDFYLEHLPDGTASFVGSIYTQPINSKSFEDPVTLMYGHTLPEYDVSFTELHKFQNRDFFAANDTFRIYLPDRILIYEVVAQYEYDNRLITTSFDFSDKKTLAAYYDYILHPTDAIAYVREGATLNAETDKIVQLSTCTDPDIFDKRYIITGKLTGIVEFVY